MERDVPSTSDLAPADPPPDQPGKTVPGNIALMLHVVSQLLGYGQHLLDTLHRRAASPTFTLIAACFGTAKLSTITAHLKRGLLRATALQRVLLARAATGRDFDIVSRRRDEPPLAPADLQSEPPAASKRKRRRPKPAGSDDPELYMPTLEELEHQIRRRSIGRTMADICLDLGVVPGLCSSTFWNQLFDILYHFGGHGVETFMEEKHRREQAFIREQDLQIGSSLDWLHLKRDEIRQILGFLIGEPPVDPFAQPPPGTAPAPFTTGPP
jgi:hypothetical protein